MNFRFCHNNFNVLDLEKSIAFYEKALGLKEVKRKTADDGSFILVYLSDGETYHTLALEVEDFDKAYELHKEMGCICFENKEMGIYFINDPDNYWIEILPANMK